MRTRVSTVPCAAAVVKTDWTPLHESEAVRVIRDALASMQELPQPTTEAEELLAAFIAEYDGVAP